MRVQIAPMKITLRRPSKSPTQEQERAPKRAPMVKEATTAPCLVECSLFTAPLKWVVSISGKCLFQSLRDSKPPTPDWLYPKRTKAGKTTSKSWLIWRDFPVRPMVMVGVCEVSGGSRSRYFVDRQTLEMSG